MTMKRKPVAPYDPKDNPPTSDAEIETAIVSIPPEYKKEMRWQDSNITERTVAICRQYIRKNIEAGAQVRPLNWQYRYRLARPYGWKNSAEAWSDTYVSQQDFAVACVLEGVPLGLVTGKHPTALMMQAFGVGSAPRTIYEAVFLG
jgi:hypothetical protein